ncbi:MAG TPA: hypothetical protein VIH43_08530, partial [Chthoniobacterales bacterium]
AATSMTISTTAAQTVPTVSAIKPPLRGCVWLGLFLYALLTVTHRVFGGKISAVFEPLVLVCQNLLTAPILFLAGD